MLLLNQTTTDFKKRKTVQEAQSRLLCEYEIWLHKTDQAASLPALFGGECSLVVKPRQKTQTRLQTAIKILINPSTSPNKPPRFYCSLHATSIQVKKTRVQSNICLLLWCAYVTPMRAA